MKPVILFTLLICIIGCAPKIPPPSPKVDDYGSWRAYYKIMFDEYGENTLPPKESDPESARIAYMNAHKQWERSKTIKSIVYGTLLGITISALYAWAYWELNYCRN